MTENNQTTIADNGYESRQVVVVNEHGLHARPAGKLAQRAQGFAADILLVQDGGQEVDAKSILDVLTLAAGPGDKLEIRATGDDAAEAADSLVALFRNKFEE